MHMKTLNDPQTWTKVWELTMGDRDGMGGGGKAGKIGTYIIE